MYCKDCGAELKDDALFCDKCGKSINKETATKSKSQTTNILSIIGVVVSGISLFLNFWGLVGIAAVVISSIALIQINKSHEKGKGMAITGIAIGGLSIFYAFIMILLLS